jgi:hypothetical protein
MNRTVYRDPTIEYRKQQEARDEWNRLYEEKQEALRLMEATTRFCHQNSWAKPDRIQNKKKRNKRFIIERNKRLRIRKSIRRF